MADYGIIKAADNGDPKKLKDKMEEIGDVRKFRRMCDSEIDCNGHNVLYLAAGRGALDMCKFLVEQVEVDINFKSHKGNNTPLMIAAREGHVVTAQYLIECGAEITSTDDKGYTALHLALVKENKELVIMLLKKGADIEADSMYGTPLHYAIKVGNAEMVKILIQNNAQPNSISKFTGISPLISGIYFGRVECVELLLEARADANKFANGLSPLALAIQIKSNKCIDALLAAGADVDSVCTCDLRPIELAAVIGNLEAIWILIQARPRLMAAPNFSLDNMLNRVTVVEAIQKRDVYLRNVKPKGDDSWDKQDYSSAIASYTEALNYNPKDENLLANRSLCWARTGEGVFALNDAQECVKLKPDWGKAHLGVATAWHLLKRYHMSSDTFKRAFEMDPENEEIDRDEIDASRV